MAVWGRGQLTEKQPELAQPGCSQSAVWDLKSQLCICVKYVKELACHGFVHFSPVMKGCKRACWGDHRCIGSILSNP